MPLVSIIVPIYNVAEYLPRCLDSIQSQTLQDWEAILVDDGSPDNSGKICDDYAAKDSRFKVIHKANGGVSTARQRGKEAAQGEYLIHVDSDDWIEPVMLEEMIMKAQETGADMVICDFSMDSGNKIRIERGCIDEKLLNYTGKEIKEHILSGKIHGSCCNKLIKKELAVRADFTPDTISMCEDLLFNARIIRNDDSIIYIPIGYYHYRINRNDSVCNSVSEKVFKSRMLVIAELEKDTMIESDWLHNIKKMTLEDALRLGKYDELKSLYPETNRAILNSNIKYSFFTPMGGMLKFALKGYPKTAHTLLSINFSIIKLINTVRAYHSDCK